VTAPSDQPLATRLAAALGDAYTIEGEVGRGGMGVVYRARDERLQRRVAIKVLPPELAFQTDIRERFTREAQTAAKLSHPHIVPIHTVGEGHGLVYFVMGYVDGESVASRIRRRGKLPVEEVRRIMAESADALGAAHGYSIIHRDIKPDNILLEGERVLVADFGVARAVSEVHEKLTATGMVVGTPTYMSPEQATGEREIDGRSDIFALACVLYELLAGEPPFDGPTPQAALMRRFTGPPRSLRPVLDVPEALEAAVLKALARDPKDRFPTVAAFSDALTGRSTVPQPEPEKSPAKVGRRGCLGLVVMSLATAAAASFILS
jgi:serine/threonine protein kinase